MKKLIVVIGAMILMGSYGIYQYQTPKLEISQSKLSKTFKDIDDLDIQNPLIVIGKKLPRRQSSKKMDKVFLTMLFHYLNLKLVGS